MSAGWLSTAFALQKGVQGPGWEPDPGANEATAVAVGCSGVAPPSTSPPGCGPSRRAPQGTPAPRHRADRSDVRSKTHDLNQSFTISRETQARPVREPAHAVTTLWGSHVPLQEAGAAPRLPPRLLRIYGPCPPPTHPVRHCGFGIRKGFVIAGGSLSCRSKKKKKRIRIQFRAMTHKG